MNHIIKTTIFLLLLYSLAGCSYVSDTVEGLITERASFSINAEYKTGPDRVVISWAETDLSADFAGIEIYRSSHANDEYATYEMIAYRWDNPQLNGAGNTPINPKSFNDTPPLPTTGVYFYRVGFVQWDDSKEDRQAGSGYTGANPGYTDFDQNTYNNKTSIDKVSGYAKVYIP